MSNNITELRDSAAEGGVIASLIYHPEFLLVDNNLRERFFYGEENQVLYWGINKLVSSGVTNIDGVNLRNALCSHPAVQKVADRYGLTNLSEYINLAKHAARGTYEEYKLLANTVVMYAFRRELCLLSADIGKECFNMELSLDDLNDYVNNGINHIAERFIFGGDTVQFGEKIDSIWKEICEDRNEDGTVGIPNKIQSLNDYFTYGKGEMVLVAGPTGKGKSSFFLAQSVYAMQQGIPVVIIDTELTDKVWAPRLLACLTGVPVRIIKSGRYLESDGEKIKKAIEWIKKSGNLCHEFRPIFNKLEIEQICRKWVNKGKLDFLVYDYIKPSEKYGAAEISQSMGLMADFLKGIAGNMNIPVLGGLQLNTLTGNVADSMKPERYSDVLMYWKPKTFERQQKDGKECGNFMVQVVKNRNGSIHDINDEDDFIDIDFRGDYMKITEAEQHDRGNNLPFGGG